MFSSPENTYCANTPKGITLSREGSSYIVSFDLPEYSTGTLSVQGENFDYINIEDYGRTSDVGYPQFPLVSFNLFISDNERPPVIEDIQITKELKILTNKVYPAQAPWPKNLKLDDRPFTINRDYYNSKGKQDAPFVVISDPFIIGGVHGVRITIYPFSYNPADNELYPVKHGSFKIRLVNQPSTRTLHSVSYNDYLKAVFTNYEQTLYTQTNNYLIITAPEYESTLAPFIVQKTALGSSVYTVNTNATGTTTTAIRNYIQTRYNNMSTRPEFILLVGDVDRIPEWVGGGEGNPHTDLNYALLEGNDFFADAFLGRFSVSSTGELTNAINKSLFMENSINSLPKKSIFMASNDNYTVSEGTHNFVIDSFFNPSGYTFLKLYCHTYNATTQQLIDTLNANQTFAIYSGHGSETSWADGPPLGQSQVSALTNTIYPFVYSFSCLTGQFQYPVCFGETWIRSVKGGSVYWGSTIESYWDEDDILERRLYRAMFTDHLIKSSPMFVMAKTYFVQYYGSITATVQRYLEMYNLLGDPSIYEATHGPSISHTPFPNTENLSGPYVVNCIIAPAGSPIDPARTRLFWSRNNTSITDSLLLTNISGNNWTGNVPGNGLAATYRYYLKTADMLNRITTAPAGAPANLYSFIAAADTVKPVIVHTPIIQYPQIIWPVTINAVVTDNIGIDSVWVNWYKNTPSLIKEFRLNNTGGSSYSAAFNSQNNEVAIGDSVFYVIKARDNSGNHNLSQFPASGYFKIQITSAIPLPPYCLCDQTTYTPITGTAGPSGDDATITVNIGFNFNFMMSTYTQASICTNGFVVLGASSFNSYSNDLCATASGQNPMLAPFWDDLNTISGGNIQYTTLGSSPNRIFVVQYTNVAFFSGSGNITMQVRLYEFSNRIEYIYGPSTAGSSASGSIGETDTLGGTGHVYSITPGSTCGTTTFSQTVCNNAVSNSNLSSGTRYMFNCPVGIGPVSNAIPHEFKLFQNYPNPFNPATSIKYSIPKQNLVKLVIFDVLGREVTTLVNEMKLAGDYSVTFDGSGYASGVYFYRIEVGDFMDVKKMVLIK